MTNEMMNLKALLGKSADSDLLREMIGFTAKRLMELEVEELTGAAPGERSAERINQRNGYRDRIWETAPAPSNCGSRSCARAVTSPAFLSRAACPGRRSRR
jgi:putative transposase